MSTDNPVIMFIFLIYSLVPCWVNVSNSNVAMKFTQLHYFLSQNVGGTKDIMSPLSKCWGDMSPPSPLKLGPCMVETKPEPEIEFWLHSPSCGASKLTDCGMNVVCHMCTYLSSFAWASEGVQWGLRPFGN